MNNSQDTTTTRINEIEKMYYSLHFQLLYRLDNTQYHLRDTVSYSMSLPQDAFDYLRYGSHTVVTAILRVTLTNDWWLQSILVDSNRTQLPDCSQFGINDITYFFHSTFGIHMGFNTCLSVKS